MLPLLVALLTSPIPAAPPTVCRWWSRSERRCRDADMEIVGEWDPRPSPDEWPHSVYYEPKDFGAYPTEKPVTAPHASYLE